MASDQRRETTLLNVNVFVLLSCVIFSVVPIASAFSSSKAATHQTTTTTTTSLLLQSTSSFSPCLSTMYTFPNCSMRRKSGVQPVFLQQGRQQARKTLSTTTTTTTTSAMYSSSTTSSLVLLDTTVAVASFSATLKLLCSIALGAWAARKQINKKPKNNTTGNSSASSAGTTILDASAISALSRLTYWIFQPAFLFCSVTKTFAMVAVDQSQMSSSSSMLSGSQLALMPLVAMYQIGAGAVVGSFLTKRRSSRSDKGTSSSSSSTKTLSNDSQSSIIHMCTTFANSGPLPLLYADALIGSNNPAIQAQIVACISFYLLSWSPLFWSFGKLILGTSNVERNLIGQGPMARLLKQSQQFLSPPVVGSILGIIVGSNTFLRTFFIKGLAYPLYSAVSTIGTAYLPAALLVLAGSVASVKPKNVQEMAEQEQQQELSVRSIATIALARFVLAPCLALACVFGLNRFQLLGPVGTPARAILSFVILMEGCMPPAQNSVILLQIAGLTGPASTMAKTLTILYGLAIVPVTLLLSLCLSISGIVQFL